jgi:hypothetical protein
VDSKGKPKAVIKVPHNTHVADPAERRKIAEALYDALVKKAKNGKPSR